MWCTVGHVTDGQKWNVVHDNESIYEDQQGKAGSAGRDKLGAGPRSGKSSVIPIGAVDVDKNSFKRSATVYLVACTQNAYHECYFLQLSTQSIGDDAPLRCHPSVHRTEHPTSRKPRMPMEPSPLVWALFGRREFFSPTVNRMAKLICSAADRQWAPKLVWRSGSQFPRFLCANTDGSVRK